MDYRDLFISSFGVISKFYMIDYTGVFLGYNTTPYTDNHFHHCFRKRRKSIHRGHSLFSIFSEGVRRVFIFLFIIGWNIPNQRHPLVLTELRQMTEVFPKLDSETLWHRSSKCGTIFTASMHTADQAASPRRYVTINDEQVVFYSGFPVNSTGTYTAHRAEALSVHWDQLTENLEGQYFIVRATDNPLCLELFTDILGLEQVFYIHENDSWLVSNSVHLIERIFKSRSLDPLGVSLFLSMGWVGADRTLRSDIRVIQGGQYWTWKEGDDQPRKRSYYPPSRLACQTRQALTPSYFKRLSNDLVQLCINIGRNFDDIKCTLTGGRDSRLLVALLIRAELPTQYYHFGDPSSADAKIGKLIAEAFNLPYKYISITTSDVINNWEKICWQSVRQNDGMRSFNLLPGVLQANLTPQDDGYSESLCSDRLNVSLWGNGGEIARGGFYNNNLLNELHRFLGNQDKMGAERFLVESKIKKFDGLVRQEGVALARDYIHRFVMKCVDDGFAPIDIPDVFYAYQRAGRRGGTNSRGLISIRDVFSPFCSRSFVEAAFAMSALQRYTEPLHYNLLRLLSRKLHKLPFKTYINHWPLQQPAMNLLYCYWISMLDYSNRRIRNTLRYVKPKNKFKKSIKKPAIFDQSMLFEAKREHLREFCMDQKNSVLWNFVDRSMFDRIMLTAVESAVRSRYESLLYRIVTLFYYDADDRRYTTPGST